MAIILFFKAQSRGDDHTFDMFSDLLVEQARPHKGYTDRAGVYHAAHQQRHMVRQGQTVTPERIVPQQNKTSLDTIAETTNRALDAFLTENAERMRVGAVRIEGNPDVAEEAFGRWWNEHGSEYVGGMDIKSIMAVSMEARKRAHAALMERFQNLDADMDAASKRKVAVDMQAAIDARKAAELEQQKAADVDRQERAKQAELREQKDNEKRKQTIPKLIEEFRSWIMSGTLTLEYRRKEIDALMADAARLGIEIPDGVIEEELPRPGDVKVENGISYEFRGSRWHRTTPTDGDDEHAETNSNQGTDNGPLRAMDMGSDIRPLDNTTDQPYQKDGIKLSRGEHTQYPAADQLPETLSRHLRPHAKDAVNLALEKFADGYKSFLCADGTGAGKTRQALAVAQAMRDKEPNDSVLIVTQNSRVIANAFLSDADKMGLHITPIETSAEITEPGIYVTTYTRIGRGDFSEGLYGTVILDEAHNLKNFDSAKTRHILGHKGKKPGTTIKGLLHQSRRSMLLTATPGDKPEQIRYICAAFGLSFFKTMERLGYQKGQYGWELRYGVKKTDAAMRMGALFDGITREGLMVKREVSMDNIDVGTDLVRLSADQERIIAGSHNNMLEEVDSASPQRRGMVKMLGLSKLRTALEPMKIPITADRVSAEVGAGRKVVVFANRINAADLPTWWDGRDISENSVGTLDTLAEVLEGRGLRIGRLYGKHLGKAAKTINSFQDGDTDVVIATPQAGGTGINLDDTTGKKPRSMVIMTAPFSALDAVQMIGRVNRLTTKSRAAVSFVQADGVAVDDWNFGIIKAKLKTLGATVQGDITRLDLSSNHGLADQDIADAGAVCVPVQQGEEITLASLGLRKRATGDPIGGAPVQEAKPASPTYLNVPYEKRETAKYHGARWDPGRRQWYVLGNVPDALSEYVPEPAPAGVDMSKKIYLRVPFEDRGIARDHGGRWDADRRQWYVMGSVPDALAKYDAPTPTATQSTMGRPVMTQDQIRAVQDALLCVAGSCDGAKMHDDTGFNQMDSANGKWLASLGDLTEEQAYAARRLVYKYKGQFGEDLANAMGNPKDFMPTGTTTSGRSYLRVPYERKDYAKRFGARWDADRRQWYYDGDSVPYELEQFAKAFAEQGPIVWTMQEEKVLLLMK